MIARFFGRLLALWASCTVATAQLAGPGLTWAGSSGGQAGRFVPSCTDLPVAAVRGERVRLTVWGDPQSPFALLAGPSAKRCLPFPGLGNALMLDPPMVVVGSGTLTQTTPCLSCPPGLEPIDFTIPFAVPLGTSVSFQALGYGALRPAFTVAITATVR